LRPKNTDFQILKLSPNYQSERGIGTIVSFSQKAFESMWDMA